MTEHIGFRQAKRKLAKKRNPRLLRVGAKKKRRMTLKRY